MADEQNENSDPLDRILGKKAIKRKLSRHNWKCIENKKAKALGQYKVLYMW